MSIALVACAPPSPTTTPAAPAEPVTIEPSAASPAEPPTPEPAGASLSLRRHACFGACPVYEITLFESGVAVYDGHEHVTVTGSERKAIDPEKFGALLREADDLFARKGLSDKPAACGTDAPSFVLTIRRGEVVSTRFVSASCTMLVGGESEDLVRKQMRKRGFDYDAFIAAERFADQIDLAVPTEPWVDDPACRDLHGTLLSPPLAPSSDTGLETRRKQMEDWMVDRIRRTADLSLRLRTSISSDLAVAAAHRDRLIARGVPKDRVVVERMQYPTRDYAFRGDELTIGPSYCFAAARAAERAK